MKLLTSSCATLLPRQKQLANPAAYLGFHISCRKQQPTVTFGSLFLQEIRASTEQSAAAVVAEDSVASPTASVPEAAEQAASVPWTLAGELPLIAIHLHASDASSVTVAAFAKSLDCR